MSEEKTKLINKSRSFEERVLAQLEDVSNRLAAIEKRERPDDRPRIESLIAEFRELSSNVNIYLSNFDEKLDVINAELLQVKADQRATERRVRKVEIDSKPQAIIQEKDF